MAKYITLVKHIALLLMLSGIVKAQPASTKKIVSAKTSGDFRSWARTPPMGWNSWDCYGPSVTEAQVKANTDYMAKYLKPFGWEYIVVDIRWYVDNQVAAAYNAPDKSTFIVDTYGRYMPSPARFPSSARAAGLKPLADYVHRKGLKFGIHIMRGVPVVAVNKQLPIKGNKNNKTAADIYSTALQCSWLKDNYTILAEKDGAQDYYDSIFELYASWGIDFVKVDDLARPYHQTEIELIRNAIDKTGRKIVLSMSPGETPLDKADHAAANANMWRTVDDFWDNWKHLNYQFGVCAKWAANTKPGAWPDADMLPLGQLEIYNEGKPGRKTRFTQDEQYTLMNLWVMFRSPLIFGGNLPQNDAFTNSLLTNQDVLNIQKYSINNKEWLNQDGKIIWIADDSRSKDKYVAIFNAGDQAKDIAVDLDKLGFSGICTIRDLWAKKSAGNFSGSSFSPQIASHGSKLYRVSQLKSVQKR